MIEAEKLAHNEISEHERKERILSWTRYTPEIALLAGKPRGMRKNIIAPIPENEWLAILSGVSRVRADNQLDEGQRLNYYPKGGIRAYSLILIPDVEAAVRELFPGLPTIVSYYEPGYSQITHSYGEPAADAFAEDYFRKFTLGRDIITQEIMSREPVGALTAERHFGISVIICEKSQDILQFSPYTWSQLNISDKVQTLSFVVTKRSRPFVQEYIDKVGREENLQGTLWVISRENCLEAVEQHIRTQVMFKTVIKSEDATPVLVSRPIPGQREEDSSFTQEQAIENRVKEHVLALMIREKESFPANWIKGSQSRDRIIYSAARDIFIKGSDLNMEAWVGGLRKGKEVDQIRDEVVKKMVEAFDVVSEFTNVTFVGVKNWQLLVANLLSFYPLSEWEDVLASFNRWEGKSSFLRNLGYPRQSLKDLSLD